MLVLLVIGLISVLILPNLAGPLSKVGIKSCAKRVAAALRYAGNRAAAEKTTATALFDVENRRLTILTRIHPLPGEKSRDDGDFDGSADERIQKDVYDLPAGIRFDQLTSMIRGEDNNTFIIYFYPDGRSSGGALSIRNDHGTEYKIAVDFITGEVTLNE
jgi:general secretion pathway protein H